MSESISLAGDIMYALVGYRDPYPAFSFGPKYVSNRHTFSIVMTNTQYTAFDGLVANAFRSKFNELLIGFNVTREFDVWEVE